MPTDKPHDFSDLLTVFVTTIGSETFEKCLKHLQEQDCIFRLSIISHVAPMSAAFQRMLDECTTPYLVQVDDDMLLFPHAVRTLYERISKAGEMVAQYVCALYDVQLEEVIYALMIFRHSIVVNYPYRDVEAFEFDQIARFRADGYIDIRVPLEGLTRESENVLGFHGTHWTTLSVYIRYNMLERIRRQGNKTYAWVTEAAEKFLRRFLEQHSEVDFFALMGVLSGALVERSVIVGARNFRCYNEMPGFELLCQFVEEVKKGWQEGEEVNPEDVEIVVLPFQS